MSKVFLDGFEVGGGKGEALVSRDRVHKFPLRRSRDVPGSLNLNGEKTALFGEAENISGAGESEPEKPGFPFVGVRPCPGVITPTKISPELEIFEDRSLDVFFFRFI